MKRRLNIFTILTMLILILAACGGNDEGTNTTSNGNSKSEDKLVIGFSQPTLESPFYTALIDGAKEEAAKLGAELIVVDAQNDIEKQNSDIQSLITQGLMFSLLILSIRQV